MKDRIRIIRKSLDGKVTQEKFAEMLGTTRNALKTYELGIVTPSDTFIQLLCSKFHIAEKWLRTGEGEMYDESSNSILGELAQEYQLNETETAIIKYYLKFSPEQRRDLMRFVKGLAEAINASNGQLTDEQRELEERAAAHALLDEELDAKKKDASASASTGSEKRA